MHDGGLEDRLRAVLRSEGHALPLTIKSGELERRAALRRRERIGRGAGFLAAAIAVVVVASFVGASNRWFQASGVGSGPAASPSIGTGTTAAPTASPAAWLPPDCDPVQPDVGEAPPELTAGIIPGDSLGYGGAQVASRWNGRTTGTPGTWDGLPDGTEPAWIDAGLRQIEIVSDVCLVDVRAEALLTGYIDEPDPAPTPIPLQILAGIGSRTVNVEAPPTGSWTVRVRATFPTTDGSEAWSETLFSIGTLFDAPGLTGQPDFSEVIAEGGCVSFQLASGASAADTCHSPFEILEGREPILVQSGASLEFRLTGGWDIAVARTVAVDAELVARGAFAPEYSVDLQENVGATLTLPVTLDPGSWILRINVYGNREGDTFSDYYDVAVTVTP